MIDIRIALFAMKEWFHKTMKKLNVWALTKGIK